MDPGTGAEQGVRPVQIRPPERLDDDHRPVRRAGHGVPITGNEVGSWLHLLADEKYDGNVLSVRVTDPSGGADDISWELTVPEESP